MKMRIVCTCGRNLADASVAMIGESDYNPDWVAPINYYLRENGRGDRAYRRDSATLTVSPRPGINQQDHGSFDLSHTYGWTCPGSRGSTCGQVWRRTAEKIALGWDTAWARPGAPWGKSRGVVRVVLDQDL